MYKPLNGYYIDTLPFMKIYDNTNVLTHGMGMGMGLIMCSVISFNIWITWTQAHNLQFIKVIKVIKLISQSIKNAIHQ